jgi:hypothetical protein
MKRFKRGNERHHPEEPEQFSAEHGKTALCDSLHFPTKTGY